MLPGLSFTLHMTHIVFTKCTFFIRSYYIKSIIILTTKILHQKAFYLQENSTL